MPDLRVLTVQVTAQIDDGETLAEAREVPIPPDYDAADVRAFVVRNVEDTAFALVRRDFGRQPTLNALRASVARLIGIERVLDETIDNITELRIRIREIIETSNDGAIAEWGENVDHEA